MSTEPYLVLSEDPIRFEAVNQVTNVFFDDSNKQSKKQGFKRRTIPLKTKIQILDQLKSGDTPRKVARFYNLKDSTIWTIQKNEQRIRDSVNNAVPESMDCSSRSRNNAIELTEKALVIWIKRTVKSGVKLKGTAIRAKALKLYEHARAYFTNAEEFLASAGWMYRFSQRFSLNKILKRKSYAGQLQVPLQELSDQELINIALEAKIDDVDDDEIILEFDASAITTGLKIAKRLEQHFLKIDPDKMRSRNLQNALRKCMAEYVNIRNAQLDEVVTGSVEIVFAVRSGGVLGVVVKGPNEDAPKNFRMEDHGPVISIKFSLDRKILAVQRTSTSVEFMNYNGTSLEGEYSQQCKKNSAIVGFVWFQNNEVAFMTDHGIELYLVIAEKKTLKHLKTASATIQWFVWCPLNKIALLASAHGSHLQPAVFKPGTITKLPKVETEPGRMALERDVTLATLYGTPAVLIIRHQTGPHTPEVHVHTLNGPGQAPVKTHVLRLGLAGRFATNVVDNLILIHHQASRCSLVFDVGLPGESDGTVTYHGVVAPPRSLKSTTLAVPGLGVAQTHVCELYSPNWVVFQPNVVIDAKLGCYWQIELNLRELCRQITDLAVCTQLALKREGAKEILLELLLDNIKKPEPPLNKIQESFNHINCVYRAWMENELQNQTASPVGAPVPVRTLTIPPVLIKQDDVYIEVLQKLDTEDQFNKLEWILIAYMTSLCECDVPAQHNLNEMLVTTLVRKNKFTSLQQLLQYGVVSDSKPLACLLLSLGNVHPSASQLALDMLTRLNAIEEIQEVLLSQGQILLALKLANENISPRKFLEAAKNSGDPTLLHSTLTYFKTNPKFANALVKDERLGEYVKIYKELFPS